NGANGSYWNIASVSGVYAADGDVLLATATGSNPTTITLYKNGTQIAQAVDTGAAGGGFGAFGPWTSGNPGIGFYDPTDSNWSSFGFSSFTATDGITTAIQSAFRRNDNRSESVATFLANESTNVTQPLNTNTRLRMHAHLALFAFFGAICVAGAINLLAQRHPISSALSLIVVMGSLAVEYMLLGAEFVAVVQVIIYAGAIMVLFVFVIMLLNAVEEERSPGSRIALLFGVPGMLVLMGLIAWVLIRQNPASGSVSAGALPGTPPEIGRLLFRDFLLPFEITSVLILIAIMGAVVLARRER
ncbi:MAG: NADH-quinone oxidoreductase subunit J, partial [Terriglobales bacterium]